MPSYNSVTLVGNLGRDPELKQTKTGLSVCEVGLAINNRRKDGEDWKTETTWIDVTFWDTKAELVAQYCHKGSCILVEGRLTTDQWKDKEGNPRSKIKVVANQIQLLDRKEGGASKSGAQPSDQPPTKQPASRSDEDSSIPF